MKLAVTSVLDNDGILLRKAIIRCDFALNTSGFWEIAKLFQHLQGIIQRYPMESTGSAVQQILLKISNTVLCSY